MKVLSGCWINSKIQQYTKAAIMTKPNQYPKAIQNQMVRSIRLIKTAAIELFLRFF
ncbi:MAG: hypothetical protein ACFCUM_11480 [Bacteroidales bacterium]